MANEITCSGSITYLDANSVTDQMSYTAQLSTSAGLQVLHGVMSVTTSEVVIPLGPLSSIGKAMLKNLDATNYVEVRVGTGSTKMLKILPGETVGPFRFGSGVTAPYIIADTATCKVEYLLIAQ